MRDHIFLINDTHSVYSISPNKTCSQFWIYDSLNLVSVSQNNFSHLEKIFRYQIGRVNEAAFYTRIGTNLGVNCPLKRASRH